MQPETRFKQKVQKLLDLIPGLWRVKIQQKSLRGIPDMLVCINGRFIALELKVGKNKPDPLQEYTMRSITLAGGYAWEVTPKNLEKSIAQIQNIGGLTPKTILELEATKWDL